MAYRATLKCDNMWNNTKLRCDQNRKDMVHQHMLAHYRRLYSAKCGIDTSTPAYFKPRYKPKPRSSLPTATICADPPLTSKDLQFLKSFATGGQSWGSGNKDHKSRPAIQYCKRGHTESSKEDMKISSASQDTICNDSLPNQSEDNLVSKQNSSALSIRNSQRKKIDPKLKRCARIYAASSKLREMSVYHPPRRRVVAGGVNKVCGQCSLPSKKGNGNDNAEVDANNTLFANEISTVVEEQKEELLYLRFIQDITQDILSNEVFSNEGVMMMFKKHISLNKEKLEKGKMLREVAKLGAKIGLPNYNYSSLWIPRRLSVTEDMGESENYSKLKSSMQSLSLKRNSVNEFSSKLSFSHGEKDHLSCDAKKDQKVFEKPNKENRVLGFLAEMGFDSNIAEEICVCMTDKEFTKFKFSSNEAELLDSYDEIINARKNGESGKRDKHQEKCMREMYHYCDTGIVFENDGKSQTEILFDQEESLEMERILESINYSDISDDLIDKVKAMTATVNNKTRDSEKMKTSVSVLQEESVHDNKTKLDSSELKSNVNPDVVSNVVASPMGSDYSSMKEHDSIYEDDSEDENDEQDSASEVVEEIPDDLSQSSVSSGISQITEKLKDFNVDVNSVFHGRTSESKKISSENNNLRELIF